MNTLQLRSNAKTINHFDLFFDTSLIYKTLYQSCPLNFFLSSLTSLTKMLLMVEARLTSSACMALFSGVNFAESTCYPTSSMIPSTTPN